MRASEKRASRWAVLLSAKCARSAALPLSTRPAGAPPALRRHSKSSVTQAAISSTSALLKALPKRRNRSSMASGMRGPPGVARRIASKRRRGGHVGQPPVDCGFDFGGAQRRDLAALLAAVGGHDVDGFAGDVAME